MPQRMTNRNASLMHAGNNNPSSEDDDSDDSQLIGETTQSRVIRHFRGPGKFANLGKGNLHTLDPTHWADLGQQYSEMEEYADAADAFREASSLAPDDTEIQVHLATALILDEKMEESFSIFEKVLKKEPNNVRVLSHMANALQLAEHFDRAEEVLLHLLSVDADVDGAHHALMAVNYNLQEKFEQALEHLNIALERTPSQHQWYRLGAAIYAKIGDELKSIKMEEKAIELGGERNAEYYHNIAVNAATICYEAKEEAPGGKTLAEWQKKAEDNFISCLEIEPGQLAVRERFVDFMRANKNTDGTIEQLNILLAQSDGHPYYLFQLALAHKKKGDPDTARQFLNQALEKDPYDPQVLAVAAMAEQIDGDVKKAIELGRRSIEADSRDKVMHYNLVCFLAVDGQVDEAFTELEKAIDDGWTGGEDMVEDEDLKGLREADEGRYEELIERADEKGRDPMKIAGQKEHRELCKAIEELKESQRTEPGDLDNHVRLAIKLKDAKRFLESMNVCLKGKELFPGNILLIRCQSEILHDQGKYAEAAALLKEFINQAPNKLKLSTIDVRRRYTDYLFLSKQYKECVQERQAIQKLLPDDLAFQSALAMAVAYNPSSTDEEVKEAKQLCQNSLEHHKDSPGVWVRMAEVLARNGDYEDALEKLKTATSLGFSDGVTLENFAQDEGAPMNSLRKQHPKEYDEITCVAKANFQKIREDEAIAIMTELESDGEEEQEATSEPMEEG